MKKSFPILLKKIFLITLLTPYTLNCMQNNIEIKENATLTLESNQVLNKKILFKGTCNLQGNSNALTLGDDALISIAPESTLFIKNITIKNIDNKIKLSATSSKVCITDEVTWQIKESFNFDEGYFVNQGGIFTIQKAEINKKQKVVFLYTTAQKSLLCNCSLLKLENVMFCYNPKISNPRLIEFVDQSSYINFVNSNIFLEQNLHLTKGGGILFQKTCQFWGKTDCELMVGDGQNKENDTPYILAPGASIEVKSGKLIYNNVGIHQD